MNGKLEKPRAVNAHDSNENQTVEVRAAKGLTSLIAKNYGRRHDVLDRTITQAGQRIVSFAESERVFIRLNRGTINDVFCYLTEQSVFSTLKAIFRQSEYAARFDELFPCEVPVGITPDEVICICAAHYQDGSERDYVLLFAANRTQIAFLASGFVASWSLLAVEPLLTLERGDEDGVCQAALEIQDFVARLLPGI